MDAEKLRGKMLANAREYYAYVAKKQEKFVPGKSKVHYAGRVYNGEEVAALVDAALDFWLTAGRHANRFEQEFAAFSGCSYCSLVNSGSSANLVALSALTSDALGLKKLSAGDRVITCATGFPTTVNPIFQNGMVPVFSDVELGAYNAIPEQVKEAAEKGAKAIMLAHTLGNPFDLDRIHAVAKKHGLYLIEDCCDAVGAEFGGKPVGTFGDFATASFYPAHHITMGEGGAVLTNSPLLKKLAESFRDWGRDCWCKPGCDNTCGKRFSWKMGDLPAGYDHKYVYSNIGYNLKVTDMQAAVGVAQLAKLPGFIKARMENFAYYEKRLSEHGEYFIMPSRHPKAKPSPFGFPLTVKNGAPFSRNDIVSFLEAGRIETRMLFGGNLARQPAYRNRKFEKIGSLGNSDIVMKNTFWIGVYPGLTGEMREYVCARFDEFVKNRGRAGHF